ncbi:MULTISPECIES: VOC family protein [Alphaproteobacteria]|uniref:Glyoxalase n=2 Tax=Alphaproteobacteria TaxID=28211 RepID=A0A512HGQ8_9HYPH|nr:MULTISPECIES: VOC family protein [Alphaproteobacteria]GEO84637.1 glyoxalase [Ciceribacter naphthalenivorans]GLR22600.1 glyoxalase [Ciceribacter naphthalenivorans]GLT05456.1 glyoxalase [Sphingomonas psychrolutea]
MLDHVGLSVSDYANSKAFYDAVMPSIGAECVMAMTAEETGGTYEGSGYGLAGKPSFWIGSGDHSKGQVHIAFTAPSRAAVDAFYAAAIAAGARDNGGPGLRPHYHPDYYAAFVLDPDGHNIEAVCHTPE